MQFPSSHKIRILETFDGGILQNNHSPSWQKTIKFGPFNLNQQKRWKKPVVTARTRLEDKTRDLRLEKLMSQLKSLKIVLQLEEMMSKRRGSFVSVQRISRWKNIVGLNVGVGIFLHKYPHIFDIFTHPFKRNLCCKLTQKMAGLLEEEANAIKDSELLVVERLKKLLMISTNGTLHIHALRLVRKELGLPQDFRDSILLKYQDDFKLVDLEVVALVSRDEGLVVAEVESWREKEYREKWLGEFETKYAFQIHFPTGFKIEKGYREKLKNWQRMPYLKPYEENKVVRIRTCGGIERFEKRVVGIIHEFLSLTVEKMVEVERLAHFRKDFSIETNIRELLLRHPGIFYISTKGNTQTVFLREAYSKGYLIEPNPIYTVRRKMIDLLLLGRRNIRQLKPVKKGKETPIKYCNNDGEGDWVIPILESFGEPFINLPDFDQQTKEQLNVNGEKKNSYNSFDEPIPK